MIARVWRGRTRTEDADRYLDYLRRTGLADCRATPGNRGVQIQRRMMDGRAEFVFTSFWDSMDSIRAFAGEDVHVARYYPEDAEMLLAMPPDIDHFDVVEDVRQGAEQRFSYCASATDADSATDHASCTAAGAARPGGAAMKTFTPQRFEDTGPGRNGWCKSGGHTNTTGTGEEGGCGV